MSFFVSIRSLFLRCTLLGAGCVALQCGTFSDDEATDGGSSSGGDSARAGGGAASGGGAGFGGASGGGENSGGTGSETSCPTIWKGCPPLGTDLEPLHERLNGAGSLLLAHGAFWLQGEVVFRNPDGSRGEGFLGALRIPSETGSTPRVLEGNVTIGEFVSYDDNVYHPEFGEGGMLAVYEPNGDLHHLLDVAQGDTSAASLQSPTFIDRTLVLTTPNCRSLFFINIDDWSVERLDNEADYLGGVTSLTSVGQDLYCMGDGYIFKVGLESRTILAEWRNPELEMGVQGVHYSWVWDTPQGLLTWRRSLNAGDESRFQLLEPDTLAFSDYESPAVTLGGPRYRSSDNTVYFHHSLGTTFGSALHSFGVEEKEVQVLVPEQRPWGGSWSPESEIQMDDDYFYWVESWDPDGTTSLNSAEFIVRYPRNP